jgi:5'-nucleotidase
MNILISNDDGVFAPGIRHLYNVLKDKYNVTVIAPLEERSATGHTLSMDVPLRVRQIEENIFGCSGFPSDCIQMGLGHLLKDIRPDLVISGINRGANLGQDLYYSGTVAAAREASFHGVPSIAVSLAADVETEEYYWETAGQFMLDLVDNDIHDAIPDLSLLNINIPNLDRKNLQGVRMTTVGFRDYSEEIDARIDSRKRQYFWVAGVFRGNHDIEGTDCMAIQDNFVAMTPHRLIDSVDRDFKEIKRIHETLKDWPKTS